MSSPMVDGIYYSQGKSSDEFLWAYKNNKRADLAHFGSKDIVQVIRLFSKNSIEWVFCESEKAYLVLPKELIKW